MEHPDLSSTEHRLHKFSNRLRGYCATRSGFRKHMIVNLQHLSAKASSGQAIRLSLSNNETIVSIIVRGILNEQKSQLGQKLEAAFDAVLKDFEVIDYMQSKVTTIPQLTVRVVVREGKRNMVVTVYPDDGSGGFDLNITPEITYDIWT